MLSKCKFENCWEALLWWVVVIITTSVLFTGVMYANSSKVLTGYYMNHVGGTYTIYINWENAPDEAALRTFDHRLALTTLQELNDSLK